MCPFGTVECDDYNSFGRRAPIEGFGFAAPNDKMAIERHEGFGGLRSILLYGQWVGDCIRLPNYVDRCFYLLPMNCTIARNSVKTPATTQMKSL